jgi:uncharacterized membrane protein
MATASRAFARHDPRQARARLVIAIGAGLAVAYLVPDRFGAALRAIAGWDAAALCMGVLAWALISSTDAKRTRQKAAEDDPGRPRRLGDRDPRQRLQPVRDRAGAAQRATTGLEYRPLFIVLCLTAVVTAWALTHTAYTLRYAHLYYRDDHDGVGGLTFPGNAAPTYFDFAYFAFTIGMCFQTADVSITSRRFRRAVMAHAVLSFAYNTTILATAVSLIVGFLG